MSEGFGLESTTPFCPSNTSHLKQNDEKDGMGFGSHIGQCKNWDTHI